MLKAECGILFIISLIIISLHIVKIVSPTISDLYGLNGFHPSLSPMALLSLLMALLPLLYNYL